MITNSSFPYDRLRLIPRSFWNSVYLFPSFQYIFMVPNSLLGANGLARAFLHGPKQVERNADAREADVPYFNQEWFRIQVREVTDLIVLICGHGGRDQRCGVMGPLLGSEFLRLLANRGVDTSGDAGKPLLSLIRRQTNPANIEDGTADIEDSTVRARVAMISHIGGHAFAGNVIIYVPPSFRIEGKRSPLAGKGIWYGRVEPRHVEGIIEETIFKGNVIADLFRGGIEQDGNIMRL